MSWQKKPPPERPPWWATALTIACVVGAFFFISMAADNCARAVLRSATKKRASLAPAEECTGTDAECVVVWRPDWLSERRCAGCAWPARVASVYARGCPVCELPVRVPRVE